MWSSRSGGETSTPAARIRASAGSPPKNMPAVCAASLQPTARNRQIIPGFRFRLDEARGSRHRLSRLSRSYALRTRTPPLGRRSSDCANWSIWLRGQDLNLRPSGFEPDELPGCSTPRKGLHRGETRIGLVDGSGGDLLSHGLSRSTIGAAGLNGRVREGIGCFPCAVTAGPANQPGLRFRVPPEGGGTARPRAGRSARAALRAYGRGR